ncbi:MAG: SGNH/GDSL hydrolase family protein [Clostridia bacterium]|nr:SGNH/GDSL hydrolase family protein [Clostridia bacterium]
MELKGLKINFLGDSITEGHGASKPENCYVSKIAEKTGAICRNYGIGGTRIARQIKPSKEERYDKYFSSRIDSMDEDADIVAVFGGTNDFGHGDAPIGNINDNTPDTFYGGLNFLYKNLIAKYPDAFIFVITPLHRTNEENLKGDGSKEKESLSLREYVKIIREVADCYSLPVLDLFANSGIYPEIPAHKEKYTVDGLHPNDFGYEVISKRIIKFIKENLDVQ